MSNSAGSLFEPEPEQMGLRGDRELWRVLSEELKTIPSPSSRTELVRLVARVFEGHTGTKLERGCPVQIATKAVTGTSRGQVDPIWWIEKGVPLLCERLAKRSNT